MKKTYWITNPKGGVGKTTLAIFLAEAIAESGEPLKLLDCDGRRKLEAFLGGRIACEPFDAGASADDLRTDPTLAVSYWDRLAETIVEHEGTTIVDLGANVDHLIWQWAETSDVPSLFAEEEIDHTVIIPITAEPLSVQGGVDTAELIAKLFPSARIAFALNQTAGSFAAYAGTDVMKRIETLKKKHGVSVHLFPRCLSEAWVDLERLKISPATAIAMSPGELSEKTDLGRLAARRALGDVARWLETLYENFSCLLPDRQPEK